MTIAIESGIATFLASQLPEGTLVRRGSEITEKPTGQRIVIAAVRDVQREVGSLYNGMLTVLIQTPVIMQSEGVAAEGMTTDDHETIVAAVEGALNPVIDLEAEDQEVEAARVAAVKAALDSAVQEASDFTCGSTYCEGPQSSNNMEHLITTIEVKLGLERL